MTIKEPSVPVQPQEPDKQSVPSLSDTMRALAAACWRWSRGLDRTTRAGVICLLVIAVAALGNAARPNESDRPTSSAVQPGPSATATPSAALKTGNVPLEPDRLDVEIDAQRYASWLDELGTTKADKDDLAAAVVQFEWLADRYADKDANPLISMIPGEGVRVADDLRAAAKHLEAVERALGRRAYRDAGKASTKARGALDDLAKGLSDDVAAIEGRHKLRLAPSGAASSGFTTDLARVVNWVDGDTVDTDLGRVRVLGINSPEMTEQCAQARAAKDGATRLAPPGQVVELVNPETVQDSDRYGRMLRYIDVPAGRSTSSSSVVDVGYSLLLNDLAEARHDSQDGYEWHPRESAYRATGAAPDKSAGGCTEDTEAQAFVLASHLAKSKGEDENWRHLVVVTGPSHLPIAVSKAAKSHIKKVRTQHDKADKAEKEREERRREALARQQASAPDRSSRKSSGGGSSVGRLSGDRSTGGGSYPGYTGPRCYAPGGKSWKPC